ncbi:MAG: hypothetical protein QNI85_12015 [Desulfobacterales bacterium]|nr:hypothetical protein [Desulfobacterales bacterium]
MLQQRALLGVQVAAVGQDDPVFGQRRQADRRRHGGIAAPRQHGQRHAAQKSAGARLRSVEIAVGVEPDQAEVDAGALQTGRHPDGRTAIPGDAYRPPAGPEAGGH